MAGALLILAAAVVFGVTSVLADSNDTPTPGGSPPRPAAATPNSSSKRPWLGVDLAGISLGNGALIGDVIPSSPADNAGLQPGDVITRVNNQPINQPADLSAAIAHLHPGDQVQIEFVRGPSTYTTAVTLATTPPGYP
jgi:S1-C subfamily serine protease